MVRLLVASRIEPEMLSRCQHTGMLAGAIIVDGAGTLSGPQQLARRRLAHRPMRAAGEIAIVEAGFGEQTAHRIEMHTIAAMRGASDRKLGLAEREGVGRPTF